jgi:teichuronic acid biosynthesis glycosyltransferase TuaC
VAAQPVKVVVFSTLYPNAERPLLGVFVETRLRELLSRSTVQARVVAPIPWFWSTHARHGKFAAMARAPGRETRNGIDVLHPRFFVIPRIGMNLAPFLLALGAWPALRRLRREGFDFDLIDAHYYYPDGVAAAMLARWFGKPLAVTARGTDVNLIPEFRWPRALIRWAARRAAASIGVSEALVDRMRRIGMPPDRLRVMRNGVDLDRFQPVQREAARERLGLPAGRILLCVGNLQEHKGQRLLLEAFGRLAAKSGDLQLIFVGEGEDQGWLMDRASSMGLAGRVRCAGTVPNAELSPWYSAADALVLASSREGWPNALLESMACGTPVVGTAVGGIPEILRAPDVGRLVAQRDAASLADAISDLLSSPPDRMAIRAYAAGFSWERTSHDLSDLFESLRPTP